MVGWFIVPYGRKTIGGALVRYPKIDDFTGQIVGAIGISGPIWRLSMQALKSRAKAIQVAADRLSREFGAEKAASPPDLPGT